MAKEELYSWEQISKAESGTVFLDRFEDGLRFLIMKGGSSLCAYAGIPITHPLAGFGYDDIPVEAHGGLTFSGEGGAKNSKGVATWPEGFWWYGWDYAHAGDYCDYYDKLSFGERMNYRENETKWLVGMVDNDSWETLYGFKKLMTLAEKIYNKKIKP